jgi:AcrR family transcriptional regulator
LVDFRRAKIWKIKTIKTFGNNIVSTYLLWYLCTMEEKASWVLEQARKLYQRYGIKSVTMDDVAKHLCISKKTLYEYFSDKEDLVRQVILKDHDRQCRFIDDIEEKNLNAIEELFEVYKMINTMYKEYNPSMEFDIRKYYPDLYVRIKDVRRKRMYEAAHRNMVKGKKEGLFRRDLNAGIIARLHVSRTENLFENDLFTPEELTSFRMFHEVFVYHLQGMLSPAGRTFFEANFKKFKATLQG